MTYQEKRSLVYLFSTIIVSVIYFAYILQRYPDANAESTEIFRFWGTAILIFVPVQVVSKIIIHIIFSIINTVATQEEEPTIVDELDKLVALKATRNFYHVFMLGFMLSMALLAFNLLPDAMFICLSISVVVASTTLDLSEFYYYRRGI